MKYNITLEEGIDIINAIVNNIGTEKVSLIDSLNRIVAKDIQTLINNPPFDKSAMDGFAINYEDTSNNEKIFNVVDTVFAGGASKKILDKNEAIKIMTGAPIPNGANCVIKQEDVTIAGESIIINKELKNGENVCKIGEDISVGDILVKEYKNLNYSDIGLLASSGINTVEVFRKPRISFISTGDEVLDVDKELEYGKIFNSNKYSIISRIKELGYECSNISHINDDYRELGEEIKETLNFSDIVITTGGASVGEKDLIKEAVDFIGGEKVFWKLKIKPGSAMLLSTYNGKVIISLSGNPTAALTTFELIAKNILFKLSGKRQISINREKARLTNYFLKKSPQRRFLRGRVFSTVDGRFVEITQVKSGNGILSSVKDSNCLVELEGGNSGVKKGDIVNIIEI
ncbi:MAG: molybdopterin molybdotransferase MoeA [Clostridium sp.]